MSHIDSNGKAAPTESYDKYCLHLMGDGCGYDEDVPDGNALDGNALDGNALDGNAPDGNTADDESNAAKTAVTTTCLAKVLSRLYLIMLHINLEDGRYVAFCDGGELVKCCSADVSSKPGEEGAAPEPALAEPALAAAAPASAPMTAAPIPERGHVADALETYLSTFVESNDIANMREFCDIATLPKRLACTSSIVHDYKRKGLGWARAQIMVVNRNEDGTPAQLMFVVSDVDFEKKLQESEARAVFRAEHDALTGALNRAAFDEMCSSSVYNGVRVGLAIVDVDEFKGVNDELGHGIGDEVLTRVAEVLEATLRPQDKVFRIGGDEFAILFYDCDDSAWQALCEKVKRMHTALSVALPADKSVTLSVGVCFSPSGVQDWMTDVADSALYHTKRTGRAGCTHMDKAGNVVHTWKDDNASVEPFAVLAGSNAGIGRIEIPRDPSIRPRLYCGDTLSEIYGMSSDLTPEDRFVYWQSGINPAYYEIIHDAGVHMRAGEDVECTFMWALEGEEPFAVRAVGVGKTVGETDVYYGYHRSLKGAVILEKHDEAKRAEDGEESKSEDLMRLHYEAAETVLDSKIIAIGLVNKATGRTRAWTSRTGYAHDEVVDYRSLVRRGSLCVPAPVRDDFLHALDLENVVATVNRDGEYVFSAKLNSHGEQRYLKYHFAPYKADDGYLFEVIEDVSSTAQTEKTLEKVTKSLNAALSAANQIGYEYDFETRVATCLTEGSFSDLPKTIEDCPNYLLRSGLVHPKDERMLFDAARRVEGGAQTARCDVRVLIEGEYRWYSCEFNSLRDTMIDKNVATVLATDVTLRIASMKSFENHVESVLYENDNALSVGVFNLSKGTVKELRAQEGVFSELDSDVLYDDVLKAASEGIRCTKAREEYLTNFSRENLLALAESGETRTSMECLYEVEPGQTEWMAISSEAVINPITGDYEAIGYTRSVNELHLASILVDDSLRGLHNSLAVLLNDGDEFYLYYAEDGEKCAHHHNYWEGHENHIREITTPEEFERISPMLKKEVVLDALSRGLEPRITFDGVFDGSRVRLENSFVRLEDEAGIILSRVQNITDEEIIEKLRHDSRHDSLTGLYNREITFAKSKELLDAHPDEEFAMMKLNVRRFRMFNSFFGEEAGDELLRTIADDLREFSQDYDHIAYGRIESDIFCAFFPYDEALFTRHMETIKWRFKTFRDDFLLEASIGLYIVKDRNLSIEGMFARASTAAKEGGTRLSDVVSRYNDELERSLEEEIQIVNEMESALDQGQFAVYLQPKYNLQTGEHAGAEALVRWINPDQGIVSPSKFIPVFESNGFITSLDHYMWEQVCRLLRKWVDQDVAYQGGEDRRDDGRHGSDRRDDGRHGSDRRGGVKPVSVNLSRLSAYSPSTVAFLKDLVRKYDIDPALFEIELTESAYIDEPEKIKETLRELQGFGFKILMDDFGSGYSSLNTLRDLPVDVLKLDIGFLTESEEDERGMTVISSVMDMTKRLGLPVIAEGVETEEQVNYLRTVGCEYVQGFYFARPMPVEDYERIR